jgi:hypothetical protein
MAPWSGKKRCNQNLGRDSWSAQAPSHGTHKLVNTWISFKPLSPATPYKKGCPSHVSGREIFKQGDRMVCPVEFVGLVTNGEVEDL